jgi:hypothetical protein
MSSLFGMLIFGIRTYMQKFRDYSHFSISRYMLSYKFLSSFMMLSFRKNVGFLHLHWL